MSCSFIQSALFDHLLIPLTYRNKLVYITTQKSIIDLLTHSRSLLCPFCFPLLFFSSSIFLSFVLSSFGRHHSPPTHRIGIDVIDSERNSLECTSRGPITLIKISDHTQACSICSFKFIRPASSLIEGNYFHSWLEVVLD